LKPIFFPNPLISFQIFHHLQLFTIDGADRVDVVYSKESGTLWVLAFVETKDQSGKVSLYVDAGVATAADGGATNNHASTSVAYIPSSTALAAGNAVNGTKNGSTFATAASWGVAGSLAVSFGAAVLSPGGVIGVGAINFAGFAQTFAMSGNLPITNMPSNYKSAASGMEWVALQPKIGPASPAPTEAEKNQAAELADTSARFPYTPVEVKILPDGNVDPSNAANIGSGGQTGEVVSIPVSNTNDTSGSDFDSSSGGDASGDGSSGSSGNSTTLKPVLVVVVPIPEQDLVSSNGTTPSPFKPKPDGASMGTPAADDESKEESANTRGDGDTSTTIPASAPVEQPQQPATGGIVVVESTPSAAGGIVIGGNTPPAPVVQQGGQDSGVIVPTPNLPSNNGTDDTVVVILPGDNTTENPKSPPPSSKNNNKSPPPAVLTPTNTSPGDNNSGNNSNGNGSPPSPASENNDTTTTSPSTAPSPVTDDKGSPPPSSNSPSSDKSPPSPTSSQSPPPTTSGNGTAQQEGTENNSTIIDIPGAKIPSPPPVNTTSTNSNNSPSPGPTPAPSSIPSTGPSPSNSKSPAPAPSPAKAKSPAPAPSPSQKSPAPAPAKSPSPATEQVKQAGGDGSQTVGAGPETKAQKPAAAPKEEDDEEDGPRVKPFHPNNNGGSPAARNGRTLLLNDPLAALSSSGFSYVVVTATADGSGGTTVDSTDASSTSETIGASALSRIRTIQNAGQSSDADAHRLKSLWDVLFWTAIAVVATFVLHVCVLGLLRWRKKPVPKMLHLPRMELLVFMMTLPMIAAAGAGLLKSDNGGIVTLGVVFSVVIPFGFLGLASVFLVKFLLRSAVEQRRALYVLVATQDAQSELDAQLSGSGGGGVYSLGPSPEGSLTAAMLGPNARDSLAESGGASGSGASTSRSALGSTDQQSNGGATTSAEQTSSSSSFFQKTKAAMYTWVLRPLFGFQDSSAHAEALAITDGAAWLGRGKWDAEFVKRYGCFFEDTHGPQVLRVRSRYDPTAISSSFNSLGTEDVVGTGVLVPATSTGAAEGALQALQTFGIIFAVTKMVLFAVIINGPGGVNNIGQVMALLVVALMHVVYLRLCHPYRLRIELAAEMVASTCDLAIFACGIALIAKPQWSASERHNMGLAMLVLQAVGFLIFITVRVGLALRTLGKTVGPALKDLWPKKLSNSTSDAQFLSASAAS
jgi:hypothetical protein